jgi:hypothetical protein
VSECPSLGSRRDPSRLAWMHGCQTARVQETKGCKPYWSGLPWPGACGLGFLRGRFPRRSWCVSGPVPGLVGWSRMADVRQRRPATVCQPKWRPGNCAEPLGAQPKTLARSAVLALPSSARLPERSVRRSRLSPAAAISRAICGQVAPAASSSSKNIAFFRTTRCSGTGPAVPSACPATSAARFFQAAMSFIR